MNERPASAISVYQYFWWRGCSISLLPCYTVQRTALLQKGFVNLTMRVLFIELLSIVVLATMMYVLKEVAHAGSTDK